MDKKSQKILLTGASGLVGSRLLPRLAEAGYECVALLRSNQVPPGARAVQGSLFEPAQLDKALQGVSAIVHLAAVFRSTDTDLIWKTNLEGTRNLVEAVQRITPGARFIMASTSHVYNTDNPHPGREDDPLQPRHAYPASKVAAENELRVSGLNWSVLRFPFVYGEGDGHLEELPKHITAANFHAAMRISTIHHRDIFTAMDMALSGTFDKQVVNICDDAPTTLYELLKIVGHRMPGSSEPLANPWHLHSDGSLARSLGFRPAVSSVHQAVRDGLL